MSWDVGIFTKPWRELDGAALGALVREIGASWIELPVRPGAYVTPENVREMLPRMVKGLAGEGIRVGSVAGEPIPEIVEACSEVGVNLIRICREVPRSRRYSQVEEEIVQELKDSVPLLSANRVKLGLQNHYGDNIPNALGLARILEKVNSEWVCAVWDGAHCGLDGEWPHIAIDIVWPWLALVNFKNAIWANDGRDAFGCRKWTADFVPGSEGLFSWSDAVAVLKERDYQGDVCLTAEYNAGVPETAKLAAADASLLKRLIAEI